MPTEPIDNSTLGRRLMLAGAVGGVLAAVLVAWGVYARAKEMLVQGLITDIPTAKEVIDRIVVEAKEIITARLARMVG